MGDPARHGGYNLDDWAVKFSTWPTMRTGAGALATLPAPGGPIKGRIEATVANWPTPTARDWEDTGDLSNVPENGLLGRVSANWATPRASDGEKGGPQQSFGAGGMPLPAQTANWATPTVRDQFSPHSEEYVAAKKAQGHGMANLNDQVDRFSLLDPTMPTAGAPSSPERRSLNPLFVAWLMGWPPPASTGCGFSATAWFPFKALMRSALSDLASPRAAPPAQLALFA